MYSLNTLVRSKETPSDSHINNRNSTQRAQTSLKACNTKKLKISQNLMGSKLDQDPALEFFHELPNSSICIIPLTNRQTNGHKDNTSLV